MFRTKWTKMEEKAPAHFEEMFLRSWDNEIMFGYLLTDSAFKVRVLGRNSAYKTVAAATIKEWTDKLGVGAMPTIKSQHWLPIDFTIESYAPKTFDEHYLLETDGNVSIGYLVDRERCTLMPTGPHGLGGNLHDVELSRFKYWDTELTYPVTKKRKVVKVDDSVI